MAQDELIITILPDGTIKTTAGKISPANHSSAEGFLGFISKLAGGMFSRARRGTMTPLATHAQGQGQGSGHDH